MGFVKAGDMLDVDGNLLWGQDASVARELCRRCVEFWQWNEAGELEPRTDNEEFALPRAPA